MMRGVTTERRVMWVTLAAVLVVATAVRLYDLGGRVLWFDEAVSLLVAKAGAGGALTAAWDDTHPPLYHLLLHFWLRLIPGEYGARLLSVVAGVATVAVVFGIGRDLAGWKAGAAAGLLLALCPLHVWYSQEVRMYAVQTLLVTGSWWLLLRRRWPGYAVVTALSLYTQYTAALAIGAQAVYVLGWRRDVWRAWALSMAGVAALFAPWAGTFWHHLHAGTFGFWMRGFDWADPLRFFALLSGAIPKNPGPYWPWIVVSGAVLAMALWREREPSFWLWLLVPVAGLAAMSVRANLFLPRAIVFVAPAMALAVMRARVAVVVLVAANLFGLWNYFQAPNPWIRSDLRSAAATVAAGYQPGDLVVHTSRFSYRPFQYYLGPEIPQVVERETEEMPELFRVIGTSGLPAGTNGIGRVWLVSYPDFQRRGGEAEAWLRGSGLPAIRLDCGGSAP